MHIDPRAREIIFKKNEDVLELQRIIQAKNTRIEQLETDLQSVTVLLNKAQEQKGLNISPSLPCPNCEMYLNKISSLEAKLSQMMENYRLESTSMMSQLKNISADRENLRNRIAEMQASDQALSQQKWINE